jgi:ribosomal protein L6P/L9E|tara:strand:+ start:1171 stop:1335 length:165 start_codon:yes stop_codon:yes gene_type:complete
MKNKEKQPAVKPAPAAASVPAGTVQIDGPNGPMIVDAKDADEIKARLKDGKPRY